ncbi:TasA family protein [Bacillus cereus]|uniref:TasA family protein n=1 Tax=Bacillus cereus TaxID=1396 RepID=UPI00356F073C
MNKKWLFIMSACLILVVFIGMTKNIDQVYAEERREIDISLDPKEVLFHATNMKPGDWADRSIRISNEGTKKISYSIKSEISEGSTKLYEALKVTVKDKQKLLYEGSLKELQSMEKRTLAVDKTDELIYTVHVPKELGNEYQGLQTIVKFIFYAEEPNGDGVGTENETGSNQTQPPTNSNWQLPRTGAQQSSMILIGIGLVGFGFYFYKRYMQMKYRKD